MMVFIEFAVILYICASPDFIPNFPGGGCLLFAHTNNNNILLSKTMVRTTIFRKNFPMLNT